MNDPAGTAPGEGGNGAGGDPHVTRRGMTFLEVVMAVALLAVLASTVLGAFNFMIGRQRVEQQTLGAHELANRLVLSYLDDHNAMPDSNLPVEYGPDRYRWDLRVDPVKIRVAEPESPDSGAQASPVVRDRIPFNERVRQVTVRVWLGEESGGSREADPGLPHARITRLMYPLANRNPDSFDNMIKSDTGIRGYLDEILGGDRAPTAPPATRGTGRPAPAGAPARPVGRPGGGGS